MKKKCIEYISIKEFLQNNTFREQHISSSELRTFRLSSEKSFK